MESPFLEPASQLIEVGHQTEFPDWLMSDTSAWAQNRRAWIARWAAAWSHSDQREMQARLLDPRQIDGALWELRLNHDLTAAGFTVRRLTAADGRRAPDFLVENATDSFYCEATALGVPTEQATHDNRLAALFDYLNARPHERFCVGISSVVPGTSAFAPRRVHSQVQRWLRSLPAAPSQDARVAVEDGGWRFEFYPVTRPHASVPMVCTWPGSGSGFKEEANRLRAAIVEKAGRYPQHRDRPLLLCVNEPSGLAGEPWFYRSRVLLGSLSMRLDLSFEVTDWQRSADGVWGGLGNWQSQHLAAVLFSQSLFPHDESDSLGDVWHHPEPLTAVDLGGAFPSWRRVGDSYEAQPAQTV